MRLITIFFFLIVLASTAFSSTLYVPDDHATIQEAIAAAVTGDTVMVRPGTYVENIDFLGKAITVTSELGPRVTVIDGNQTGSPVSFQSGETVDSCIKGFTITNGSGMFYDAGGVYVGQWSDATIEGNWITNNSVPGIMANQYTYLVIKKNRITHNSRGIFFHNTCFGTILENSIAQNSGQGISFELSQADVFDNVISDNGGSGISLDEGVPEIARNVITGNGDSGIRISGAQPTLINNIIAKNSAWRGGGIVCAYWAYAEVIHNTIANNTASEGGGIACFDPIASFSITNSILWDNQADVGSEMYIGYGGLAGISDSDLKGGMESIHVDPGGSLTWGSGMIDENPHFASAADGDYHITYVSPCRNTAKVLDGVETDFEGDPRSAPDLGADEFHRHLYYLGDTAPGGNIQVKLVGEPDTDPVGLWLGSGVFDPPLPSPWGDWHLKFPVTGPIVLPPMPWPDGITILHGTIPVMPPPPDQIPMQALIGEGLSNLCVIEVE